MEKHELLSTLELVFLKLALGSHQQGQQALCSASLRQEFPEQAAGRYAAAYTFTGWGEIFREVAKDLEEHRRECVESERFPDIKGGLN